MGVLFCFLFFFYSSSLSSFGFDSCQTSPLGVLLQPELGEARLDLGELQQVLRDEELARKLQEEEEKLLRRVRDPKVCHDTL